MTKYTAALQERIAEELYYQQHPEGRHRSEWPAAVYPDTAHEYRDLAAAVLPIVEAEVRAAKAEALREAGRDLEREWPNRLGIGLPPEDYDHAGDHAIDTAHEYLKRRATEYETGDSDEHR